MSATATLDHAGLQDHLRSSHSLERLGTASDEINNPELPGEDDLVTVHTVTAEVSELLCDAGSIMNSYPPINMLPPEILGLVFQKLVERITPFAPSWRCWPRVGLVCRYWRSIMLHTPALWTTIDTHSYPRDPVRSRQLFVLKVARSGTLPLDLNVSSWDDDVITAILANVPRIQYLMLSDIPHACFGSRFLANADQLEELHFMGGYHTTRDDLEAVAWSDRWQTPRLLTVVSRGHKMWRRLNCQTLRRLVIPHHALCLSTFLALLRILSSNPTLEDLAIMDSRSHDDVDTSSFEQISTRYPGFITMPGLKRLYFAHGAPVTTLINSKLHLGPDVSLRYYDFARSEVIHDLSNYFPQHARFAAEALSVRLIRQSLIVATNIRSAIYFRLHGSHTAIFEVLRHVILVPEVQRLHLIGIPYNPSSDDTLLAMRRVSTLLVAGQGEPFIADWFSAILALNLFPDLKELLVCAGQEPLDSTLLHFIHCRRESGTPITTLRFIDSDGRKKTTTSETWRPSLSQFSSVVESVHVNEPNETMDLQLPDICTNFTSFEERWFPRLDQR